MPVTGAPCVACFAEVGTLPTTAYAQRASAVLRDAVAVGVEVYGVLYLPDALTLSPGGGLGWDGGTLSTLIQ